MPWWGWIVVGSVLLVAELFVVTDFYLAVFGVAALIVGGITALGLAGGSGLPFALFGLLGVLLLFFVRERLAASLGGDEADVPLLVGEIAVVADEIPPGGAGRAEFHGTTWTALNRGTHALAPSERARVIKADGLILHVRSEAESRARRSPKHRAH